MKTLTEYLLFNTKNLREYINITTEVSKIVKKSDIMDGMVLVSAMHITAGVFVNDDEPGFLQDLDKWLDQLAPPGLPYAHHKTGETNGDTHLKNIMVHHQVILPITHGRLDLGPWQQVFYAEFDGCRQKRVIVKVMGE